MSGPLFMIHAHSQSRKDCITLQNILLSPTVMGYALIIHLGVVGTAVFNYWYSSTDIKEHQMCFQIIHI